LAETTNTVTGVAERYATALFELAVESDALAPVGAELQRFETLMGESADLARLVRSPVYSAEEQLRAVTAILDKAGITGPAANLIKVAARNRRLFAVPDMIRSYRQLHARQRGEVSAEVTSAEPLGDVHVTALKEALKASIGKDVDLAAKVDPALLGGLIVKVGSRMIDTSLRTKLNSLKIAMKEVG
jgi:F-type H+-transporting ATPase subunit delta